jgi:hypothetical protein
MECGAHVGKYFIQNVDVNTEGNKIKIRCDDTGSWISDIN